MSDDINYKNNPLHGVGLKTVVVELVEHYGFEILFAYLNINCFKTNPSIASSIKFLKKTDWAREKVEGFYLYEYKNLPRASFEQFQLPPRERIIPEGQVPGEPKELSLEDAERLRAKREAKQASRGHRDDHRPYGKSTNSRDPYAKSRNHDRNEKPRRKSPSPYGSSSKGSVDPWAKARKKSED